MPRGGNDESNYPKPNRSAGRHSDDAHRRPSLSDSKRPSITQQLLRYRSVRLSQKHRRIADSDTNTWTLGRARRGTHVTSRLTSPEIAFIFLLLIAAVLLFYGLARRYDSEADEHQEHEEQLGEVEAMTANLWEEDEDEREASTCQRKHVVVSGRCTQGPPTPLQCGGWPCRRATRSAPPSRGPRDSVTDGRFDRFRRQCAILRDACRTDRMRTPYSRS
jgi:hypothetical protein